MTDLAIFVGSVYGAAQHVAEQVEECLSEDEVDCELFTQADVADFVDAKAILVITSTTGQGDIPPDLEIAFLELKEAAPQLNYKPFAVAGLGDSSYGESFCGAGRQFFELLSELQGNPVADLLEVDAMETLEPAEDVLAWVDEIKSRLIPQ